MLHSNGQYPDLKCTALLLKLRTGTTFDLIVYSNLRFSAGVLCCLFPCFNF